jgi:hypothetical protein
VEKTLRSHHLSRQSRMQSKMESICLRELCAGPNKEHEENVMGKAGASDVQKVVVSTSFVRIGLDDTFLRSLES